MFPICGLKTATMQDLTRLVLLKQHNHPCLPLLCWPLNSPHKVMERRKQKHENLVELINVSWLKKIDEFKPSQFHDHLLIVF